MSHPNDPSDASKPVLKDKNPHNYRKVGYSMIVISVSLVLIGLLVWAIGDNYHFSGDIMAKQEIDSMTPKSGYNVIVFDNTQPIGSKLKFLDSAKEFETAIKLKTQHTQEYLSQKGQVLIFDTSIANNTNSISLAEVYAMTPTDGYNVVSFNTVMPVGARLSGLKLELTLGDALNDTKKSSDLNADKLTKIITFSSSLEDNLKQILGSEYEPILISENINQIKSMPQKLVASKPQPSTVSSTTSKTNMSIPNSTGVITTNATAATVQNKTQIVSSDQSAEKITVVANVTTKSNFLSNSSSTTVPKSNMTSTSMSINSSSTTVPKSNMTNNVNTTS
jgi:hypothetical protein